MKFTDDDAGVVGVVGDGVGVVVDGVVVDGGGVVIGVVVGGVGVVVVVGVEKKKNLWLDRSYSSYFFNSKLESLFN